MGMYDDIKCHYPLPVKGANALSFQTKDTPNQFCDLYEIRADGTLWHEEYDIEDHSDPNANGIMRLVGCMARVNKRWVQDLFTGEICFYSFLDDHNRTGWVEFAADFLDGKLTGLRIIEHTT